MTRREKILALRGDQPLVWPSMLLCDFANLSSETTRLEEACFRGLHLDVMDGVFVPNFSYGMTIVNAFRQATDLPLDVHLMMNSPEKYVQHFHDAGADMLTFHVEATEDPAAVIQHIRELGMAAGIAIDRDTPTSAIESFADQCDLILVMTIKAGFGGQKFIPAMLTKLTEIRSMVGNGPVLQVDGGVNQETIGQCVASGAEWMVVGSGVFKHEDYQAAHDGLLEQMCQDR